MIDFNKIKQYNEQIAEILEERPDLVCLQQEINSRLEGKNSFERQRILQEMMLNKWFEITKVEL